LLLVLFSGRLVFMHSAKAIPPRLETAVPLGQALYLPVLGGGSEGTGKEGGGSGSEQKLSSGVRARSRRGFAYPGPQPMVSDPPQATLGIQTILQPELKNPPLLRQYLELPNIARPAEAAVVETPTPVIKVRAEELRLRPSADKPILPPKISLPVAATSPAPEIYASQSNIPRLLPDRPPVPGPAEISNVAVDRGGQKGLLVLNAVPPPPDVPARIPSAEARSLFAVIPQEATVIGAPGAGSKSGAGPAMAAGLGTPADVASGDALAEAPAGGSSKNASGSGTGNGGRYGNAKGTGLNPTGEGVATGRGTTAGAGSGSGSETTLGSGKGAGSAASSGGFPGMTITGGRYGNGASADMRPSLTSRAQRTYGMTIASTASSGGGLPDFGVFQNQNVYTVYLDMRANDEDSAPSWTLQYAVLQPDPDSGSVGTSNRILGVPTSPYPTLKQIPELTPALGAICARKLIVVSAILTAAGKLEQISVKKTPDSQMDALVTEALSNWSFLPAQIDGKPVALKILLGIRLSAH
jgi:hypothetical protein